MPNKNYEAGRRREWQLKHFLERHGFLVLRTAGSKSPYDLIAFSEQHCILLQSKKGLKSPASLRRLQLSLEKGLKPRYVFVAPVAVGDSWQDTLKAII